MDRYIGKTLNDRYRIDEVIGVGGMAVVYKAYDTVVNRTIAVKVLKDEFVADAQFRRRFSNESKAIAILSHPNIVDVYDVNLEEDMMYIVMEYIDGITLKEYIDDNGPIAWDEAVYFVSQILSALQHAHERGIVHRDIKPHNIMLLKDGTIKVTDFGIARMTKFETQTMTDKAIGSVHYISPEQASGEKIDEKTDIYSVGVMLYEMLTGELPFTGDTAVSVALMQVQAKPKAPRLINPDIPAGMEQITLKAMAKDPAQRYASADEMYSDLEILADDPKHVFDYEDTFVGMETPEAVKASAEEPDEDEDNQQQGNKNYIPYIGGILAAVAAVVLIIAICIMVFSPASKGGNTKSTSTSLAATDIQVPDLTKKLFEDAKQNNPDLVLSETTEYSDTIEAGYIISQDKPKDMVVKKGSTINVVVSKGKKKTTIPNLENSEYNSALTRLDALSLKSEVQREFSDTVTEGYVIRTDPAGGSSVDPGAKVTVYVSKGKDNTKPKVPDLVGLTEEEAKAKLTENNLVVGNITTKSSTERPTGTVISQGIPKDTVVAEKTAVDIVVSSGVPKPTNKIINIEVKNTTASTVTKVRIDINDKLYSNTDEQILSGDTFNRTVTVSQGDVIKVYFNGELVKTITINNLDDYPSAGSNP